MTHPHIAQLKRRLTRRVPLTPLLLSLALAYPISLPIPMPIPGCVQGCLSLLTPTSILAQDKLDTLPEKPAAPTGDDAKVNFAEVRKVLRDLDGDMSTQRDAAEKRLIELGPVVLPFLPEISSSTSGEMKIRLQRIRQQLQSTKIETFFEASLITLAGKMKLADAIASISQQSGNAISVENSEAVSNNELEFKAVKQPFWDVLESLMSQANLQLNTYSSTEGLVLIPTNSVLPGPEPYTSGPFQISVLSSQTSLQYYGRSEGQLDVSLQVAWEPRLKPVFLELPMGKMKVVVDDGGELLSTNPDANPEIPVNSAGAAAQIDLQFVRPQRSVRKLNKLSGEFVVAVPSEKHKYIFENFGNGKRQSEKYGEVTVTLENARRNGSVFELRILAQFEAAQGALDSFRGWILSNRAYLLDSKQNRLENVGLQTYSVTGDAVGVAFLFQLNSDPNQYTLVYESPGTITRQTVKFELDNIDLP
ncbi:MAG: hypothetical protein IT423_09510 [Pirellulaceae bacterium]|nr:hypothetical protein [Pirellulaceae bacterium]